MDKQSEFLSFPTIYVPTSSSYRLIVIILVLSNMKIGHSMSFSILLSLTAQLMPVSTECAAALLSFRYQPETAILA